MASSFGIDKNPVIVGVSDDDRELSLSVKGDENLFDGENGDREPTDLKLNDDMSVGGLSDTERLFDWEILNTVNGLEHCLRWEIAGSMPSILSIKRCSCPSFRIGLPRHVCSKSMLRRQYGGYVPVLGSTQTNSIP